jgi:nucleoside-triphosphatase THEP1
MTTPPRTAQVQDWRVDTSFQWPERLPWSVVGPDFVTIWGRADPADPQPEDVEVVGPKGSGKTHLLCKMLQDRQIARDTPEIMVMTKPDDKIAGKLGWPIVDDWRGVTENRQVIYWPRTGLLGRARRSYHERKIGDLLDRLWQPDSNTLIAFDEIGYIESLSTDIKATVQMYWREARSQGITIVAMKQRPQGVQRDMHSESMWTASFKPKDDADLERFAELFGAKRDWMPVMRSLEMMDHEFIMRHSKTGQAVISWIDTPLVPVRHRRRRRTPAELLGMSQPPAS